MTMMTFSRDGGIRQRSAPPSPVRAVSAVILLKIERAIRIAGLSLDRYDVWPTCLCAALACLTWLGLGLVLFGPPLSTAVPLNCSSAIECAMRTLNALP